MTLISLLEDKYVTQNSIVDCEGGSKYFYGLRIKDSHLGAGAITVKEAFLRAVMWLCQTADMYYRNQPDKWIGHLRKLRLDTLTGVDITASSGRPIIIKPSSKFWHPTAIPIWRMVTANWLHRCIC